MFPKEGRKNLDWRENIKVDLYKISYNNEQNFKHSKGRKIFREKGLNVF